MANLYKEIPTGEKPPREINIIIEIPKDEKNKYEYNEKKNYFFLDRVLYSSIFFPFNYGFIPQTLSEDGDPLDVVLLSTFSVFPGCVVKGRPIGILIMEDEKGKDNKIIAVPGEKTDPRFLNIKDIKDLNDHLKKEIETFFKDYKKLEKGKFVKIKGWKGKREAEKIIKDSIERFKKYENSF